MTRRRGVWPILVSAVVLTAAVVVWVVQEGRDRDGDQRRSAADRERIPTRPALLPGCRDVSETIVRCGPTAGGPYRGPEQMVKRATAEFDAATWHVLHIAKYRPDVFGGATVDSHHGLVHVYLTDDGDEMRRTFIGPTASYRFRFHRVERTLRQLESLQARIARDSRRLRAEGIDIGVVAADIRTNVVLVGVKDLTPAERAALTRRYGPGVRVYKGDYGTPLHAAELAPFVPRLRARAIPKTGLMRMMRSGLRS